MSLIATSHEAFQTLNNLVDVNEGLVDDLDETNHRLETVEAEQRVLVQERQVTDLQIENAAMASEASMRDDADEIIFSTSKEGVDELIDAGLQPTVTPALIASLRDQIRSKKHKRATYRTLLAIGKLDLVAFKRVRVLHKQIKIGLDAKYSKALQYRLDNRKITQLQFNRCNPAGTNAGVAAQYAHYRTIEEVVKPGGFADQVLAMQAAANVMANPVADANAVVPAADA